MTRVIATATTRLWQLVCGLRGHDVLLHIGRDRLRLQCASCPYESPGIAVAPYPEWGQGAVMSEWLLPRGESSLEKLKDVLIRKGWRFEPTPDGMTERIIRPDGSLAGIVKRQLVIPTTE